MADRDVRLIIRAKNDASRAIESVADALRVLDDAQAKVSSSAKKSDDSISRLSDELAKMNAKVAGMQAMTKLAGYLDRAGQGVERLKSSVATASSGLQKYASDADAAAARVAELEAETAALKARLDQEKTAQEAARGAILKSSAAQKELTAAQKEYNAALRVKPETAGRDDGLVKAKQRLDAAKASVASNRKAYEDLQKTYRSSRAELVALGAALREASNTHKQFKDAADGAAVALERQRATLAKGEAEYAQLDAMIKKVAGTFGTIEKEQSQLEASTARLLPEIGKLGAALAALQRFSDGAGGFANAKDAAALRANNAAIAEAETRLKALRGAYAQLNASTQLGKSATSEQKAQLVSLSTAADLAEKELLQLRGALDTVSAGMGRVRAAGSGLFSGINRESRQAMSVFQRVRGEVLALATAYVGLYGTISNIGGVINAYQQLEAAQNRLGAVFNQDTGKIAQELGFIERQASRLGIEFGTLANQYSKFAISAQAANFSQEETRRVFLSVAEAGRVNKLSLEDMNGIFLALTQMIQKGRIGSEELRQQLGERLPGAVNIMADALGLTTAELSKMMEEGEVVADSTNLIKFADELNKRFGAQLPKALQSTTTQIGKFWNNVFQAQLQVANGGFIEGFNKLLEEMNKWFESREGRDFFLSLGAAAGKLFGVMTVVAQNIETVFDIIQALVTLKVAAWFTGLTNGAIASAKNLSLVGASAAELATKQTVAAAGTSRLGAALASGSASASAFGAALFTAQGRASAVSSAVLLGSTALTTFTTRAGLAAAGARAMGAASAALAGGVRLLGGALAALGGPVGILVTLATIIGGSMLSDWATGVDGATAALDEHQRIMGEVLTAYDDVKGKTDDWADSIKNVSLDQANLNLRGMLDEYEKAREALIDATPSGAMIAGWARMGAEMAQPARQIQMLAKSFEEGKITAGEFVDGLEEVYKNTKSDKIRSYLETLLETARATEQQADKAALAAEVASELGSNLDVVSTALGLSNERLKDAAEASDETSDSFGDLAANTGVVDAAINKLKEQIPELAEEMKLLKEQTDINKTAWEGLVAAIQSGDFSKIGEIIGLWGRATGALREGNTNFEAVYTAGRNTPEGDQMAEIVAATTALAKEMGLSAKDLLTVMSYETGGTFDPWQAGPTTQWGQHRGLIQWGTGPGGAAERYGVTEATSITEQIIAAGKYLQDAGVKSGDGLLQIYAAINAGNASKIYASDANNGGAPGTVLDKVSEQMEDDKQRADALLAAYGGVATEAEKTYESEQKITEEKAKQQESTDASLDALGFDNEMLQQRLAGKEREVFIEEELRRLKEENPNITAAELAQATELLGKKYDYQKALTAEKDEKKEIREIEQQIADLETQRNELLAQRAIYEEQGNTEKLKQTDAELLKINEQLTAAIAQAQQMMIALGGEGADAAIAKMKTLGLEIENANTSGGKFRMTAQEMSDNIFNNLESGIVSAFQSFAQAVANGEDAVDALGNAFRQFAANFLMEIATMILKQTLFNALQGISKATGGGLFSFLSRHTGGMVTATGGTTRSVSPSWFNNAVRYHSGGIAGLAPDEVPTILRQGEEVLTETDPRHRANGGAAGGKGTKIMNFFDAPSFLSASLAEKIGEEAVLNYVRNNPAAFKAAMGI